MISGETEVNSLNYALNIRSKIWRRSFIIHYLSQIPAFIISLELVKVVTQTSIQQRVENVMGGPELVKRNAKNTAITTQLLTDVNLNSVNMLFGVTIEIFRQVGANLQLMDARLVMRIQVISFC